MGHLRQVNDAIATQGNHCLEVAFAAEAEAWIQ